MKKLLILVLMHICVSTIHAQQWSLITTPAPRNLYGCWFDPTNPDRGLAVGWYVQAFDLIPFAFTTMDGGSTITPQGLFQVYFYASEDIAFTNSNNGVVVGNGILHTADGGASWNIVEDATAMTGGKLKQVIFADPSKGYAVGQRYDLSYQYMEGVLYRTSNSGGSWTSYTISSEFNAENTDIRTVSCPSPDTLLAGSYSSFGTGSTLFRSVDNGLSWTSLPFYENIYSMCFTDSDTGFMASDNGIYRTVNGGDTWLLVHGTISPVRAVCMNSGIGFAGGQNGELYQTTDHGATWSIMSSPVSAIINDICMPSSNIAYAVGMAGAFLKYNNSTATNEVADGLLTVYSQGAGIVIQEGFSSGRSIDVVVTSLDGKVITCRKAVIPAKIETGIQVSGIYLVRVTDNRKSETLRIFVNPQN